MSSLFSRYIMVHLCRDLSYPVQSRYFQSFFVSRYIYIIVNDVGNVKAHDASSKLSSLATSTHSVCPIVNFLKNWIGQVDKTHWNDKIEM